MIKSARYKANFTQKELARKIGITQSYLSKLENRKSNIKKNVSVELIRSLSLELDLDPVALFTYFFEML